MDTKANPTDSLTAPTDTPNSTADAVEHTCHAMNPPFPGPCAACASERLRTGGDDQCDACPNEGPCSWCYDTGKSVPYIQRAVDAFPLLVDALRNYQNYDLTLEARQNKATEALRVANRSIEAPAGRECLVAQPQPVVDLMDALRKALPQ